MKSKDAKDIYLDFLTEVKEIESGLPDPSQFPVRRTHMAAAAREAAADLVRLTTGTVTPSRYRAYLLTVATAIIKTSSSNDFNVLIESLEAIKEDHDRVR